MRAWVLESHKGPESLGLREIPDPVPGDGECLVRVTATALNRADLLQSRGLYPGPPMEHEVPGLELTGVVEQAPEDSGHAPGDRVAALVAGGAFAERIAVAPGLLLPVPDAFDDVEAGGLMEAALTTYDALVLQGGMQAGDHVLVHAAASGIGTAAIRLALERGAKVAGSCSPEKADAVAALGAHLVRRGDFTEDVLAWTGGRGADVILDPVGGDYVPLDIQCAASRGRIIVIGLLGGGRADIDLGRMLTKRLRIHGSVIRSRSLEEKTELIRAFRADHEEALAAGRLKPVIDRVVPFEDLVDGLRAMACHENIGKIVVRIAG